MTVTNDLTWRRLSEAEGFLTLGLPQKTLTILDSRTNWSSMPFEANLLAGLAYRELGEYHKAILFLEKSARFQPGNSDVAMALGWCYKRTNRLAQAIDSLTRAIELNEITREDAAPAFDGIDHVPTAAITMGCGTILDARRIALMAWGANKSAIVRDALHGPVTDQISASFLQQHPHATFFLDRDAATQLA